MASHDREQELRRIIYLTALHPDDVGEEFFEPEISQLTTDVEVIRVPVRPKGRRRARDLWTVHLVAPEVMRTASRVAIRHPIRVLRAARMALDVRRPGASIRNLLVLPKGLWLSDRLRGGDVIMAGWLTTPATVALIASHISGVPWATNAHRRDILEAAPLRRKVASASIVRAISHASVEMLLRQGCSPARVAVIHLGIDRPTPCEGLFDGPAQSVLCVANLIPLKNHETLLRALATEQGARVRLTLAGSGPERERLFGLASALGVNDRVVFLGQVPHDELLTRLSAREWDVVTLASFTEGIPVSLIEALGRGVPVVASDVGGVSEVVAPGGGVLVANPTDAEAFAVGWAGAAESWSEEAARKASEFIDAEFSVESCAGRLLDLLRTAVANEQLSDS